MRVDARTDGQPAGGEKGLGRAVSGARCRSAVPFGRGHGESRAGGSCPADRCRATGPSRDAEGGRQRRRSAGQPNVGPLEDFAPVHAASQPDEDLTGAVDHPRGHVDQPASDELEVVALHSFGRLVTEIVLLDGAGDPFAESLSVAGGDLDGEHGDQVVGEDGGGLPGAVGGGLAHREVEQAAAVLGLLDPLLYVCALPVPEFDLGRVPDLVGEQEAVPEDVPDLAPREQLHLTLGDGPSAPTEDTAADLVGGHPDPAHDHPQRFVLPAGRCVGELGHLGALHVQGRPPRLHVQLGVQPGPHRLGPRYRDAELDLAAPAGLQQLDRVEAGVDSKRDRTVVLRQRPERPQEQAGGSRLLRRRALEQVGDQNAPALVPGHEHREEGAAALVVEAGQLLLAAIDLAESAVHVQRYRRAHRLPELAVEAVAQLGRRRHHRPTLAEREPLQKLAGRGRGGAAATARSSAPARSPRSWFRWTRWSPPTITVSASDTISSPALRPRCRCLNGRTRLTASSIVPTTSRRRTSSPVRSRPAWPVRVGSSCPILMWVLLLRRWVGCLLTQRCLRLGLWTLPDTDRHLRWSTASSQPVVTNAHGATIATSACFTG